MNRGGSSRLGGGSVLLCVALWSCGAEPPPPKPTFSLPPANPLKACSTSVYGKFVRGAACPGVELIFISREPVPEVLLQNARANLVAYGHSADPRVLEIEGQHVNALFFAATNPKDEMLTSGLLFGLDSPYRSDTIEVQCVGRGETVSPARCVSFVEAFIAQGFLRDEWPDVLGRTSQSRSFDFVGRELRLPRDCEPITPFELECRLGHFAVHPVSAEALPQVWKNHLQLTTDPTQSRERELPCNVDGIETGCNVREFKLPLGDIGYSFAAALELRGQPILVTCDTMASRVGAPPGGLCMQFFGFERGVLEAPDPEL